MQSTTIFSTLFLGCYLSNDGNRLVGSSPWPVEPTKGKNANSEYLR
jgi:hypothetical protein